jgi:sec-independent protein translocase protein TatA
MSVGPSELVVILIVVLLLFGTRRLADLGKGIGEGIRGFRRGIAGETTDGEATKQPQAPPPPSEPVASQPGLGSGTGTASGAQKSAETAPVAMVSQSSAEHAETNGTNPPSEPDRRNSG